MRKIRFVAALAALAAAACALPPVNRTALGEPETETFVDLARYQGLWYEIARFPNAFEKGCEGVTAQYKLRPDGRVSVLNTCRKGATDGPVREIEGRARAVAGSGNARLKVSFAPSWIPFAEGNYWVLDVDDAYSRALVGTPDGRFLWILAREPEIPDADYAALTARAASLGYHVSALEKPSQPPDTLPRSLD